MATSDPRLRLYWRPGCPFCVALRLGLRARGVPYEAHNIWEDDEDASFVRSVAGGNETVPTVALGDQALVNPSPRQVRRLLEAHAPDQAPLRRSRRLPRGGSRP